MSIEWGKAPEGTTHAFLERGYLEWRKLENGKWFAYDPTGWEPISGRPELYHTRPEGEKP